MKIPWETKITGIGIGLPIHSVSNSSLIPEMKKLKINRAEKIIKSLGINSRPVAKPEDTHEVLAQRSIATLQESQRGAEKISSLLACTQTDPIRIPTLARRLATMLEVDSTTVVQEIQSGCTGFVEALVIANSLTMTLNLKRTYIFNVDLITRFIDPKDWANRLLFSDGATVTVCQREMFSDAFYHTSHFPNLECLNLNIQKSTYSMKGLDTFTFAITNVEQALKLLMKEMNQHNIDLTNIFFHQASKPIIKLLGEVSKKYFPNSNIPTNLELRGNLNSSSIPVLISDSYTSHKKPISRKKRSYSALIGFGAGLSVTYVALPDGVFDLD
jgi:3-oxoacyl-[acyl-carrier-protein] synthase III